MKKRWFVITLSDLEMVSRFANANQLAPSEVIVVRCVYELIPVEYEVMYYAEDERLP